MYVHVDFCLIPLGGELSVAAEVAECLRVLRAAGLEKVPVVVGGIIPSLWTRQMA